MNGWSTFLVTGLLALALVKHGKAQESVTAFFDHITTADGLSYDKVRSIATMAIDSNHFITCSTTAHHYPITASSNCSKINRPASGFAPSPVSAAMTQ